MAMVKKWKIAPFINTGTPELPTWTRIKKSTAFDLTMNGETQEYDYINDESPTVELLRYSPSLNQSLTMYTEEEDYKFFFDKFYNLAVGSDAKSEMLLVFFQEGDNTEGYKAWKTDCVVTISDLNSVDSTISFDVNFNGTIAKGTVKVDEDGVPTFTPASKTE